MTPSEGFSRSFVYVMVIVIIIIWALTKINLERNNYQQEQRAKKREPVENYDDSFYEGEFKVFNCVNCEEKSPIIKISGTQNIIHKFCK